MDNKTIQRSFQKISGKNGELFHLNNMPLFAKVKADLVVALHDRVAFNQPDHDGNLFTQMGKVINFFFLESTEAIVAQIEREPDQELISLGIDQISQNFSENPEYLLS